MRAALPRRELLLGAAGFVLLLVVWEAVVRIFQIPTYILPSLSNIFVNAFEFRGTLLAAAATTVAEVLIGLALGTLVGVILAVMLVVVPAAKTFVLPPLVAIHSVPSVAYSPLALLWFGVGPEGKVFMVAFVVSYTILLNTLAGLERVDAGIVNLLRSFGAGPLAIMWRLRMPAAAKAIMTGIRLSVVRSMIVAVVTEMLGAYSGLGWIIFQSAQQTDFLRVWSAVLVTSITSLVLFALVSAAERKAIHW